MTKKDYILIAKVIRGEVENRGQDMSGVQIIGELARILAGELKIENNLFNREKFLDHCNIEYK